MPESDTPEANHTDRRGALPIVWHADYEVDIGPHVFPTRKYRAVRDRLLAEATIDETDIHTPVPASDADVGLVHSRDYLRKILEHDFSPRDELLLELPFSRALREAMWLCAGGSILTARLALDAGAAVHLGGGFHHAFPDHGEGFCLINDVAIAIRTLLRDDRITRALVVDCDLHHGNGTAAVFRDQPEVFTFSMHQERNYPAHKPPSDLDIGLDDGTDDVTYLGLLHEHLPRIVSDLEPDLAFYLAGADPYREDQLGGLELSLDGLRERDELVLRELRRRDVSVAVTLAGGYALRFEDTVEIHCQTVRAAAAARRDGAG